MDDAQRRFLNVQLVISAVLNAAISALFVWLMFRGTTRIPLWGASGLAVDLIPTTFMISLATGIALTLATRGAIASAKFDRRERRRRLPSNFFLRASVLATGATVVLVPLSVLALALLGPAEWTYSAVMVFKIIYGVALGFIVTPIVVSAAMGDA